MDPNREPLDALSPPAADAPDVEAADLPHARNGAHSAEQSAGDALAAGSGEDAFAAVSDVADAAVADADVADAGRADTDVAYGEPAAEVAVEDAPPDTVDTLSPAVRRLVRQYDLDITGIHGTGPSGRIRVGDVIGMLGGRADGAGRGGDAPRASAFGDETIVEAQTAGTPYRNSARRAEPAPAAAAEPPATTVFECDLTRVLAHRKAQRRSNTEVVLTSYYLVACGEALRAVPEVVTAADAEAQLGVLLASPDGGVRTTLVDAVDTINDSGPLASFDDRLRSFDQALRAIGDAQLTDAHLLVHHYGASGSMLATPTPRGRGHVASIGIGRVRREIVIKAADGDAAPRAAAMCYVTLTFLPERLPLHRANRFVAQLVRVLEHWPD
jgi:2-oxoglutarate dehydrogenase E2 component (dihydrolipoamide succinyltransferase)